MKVGATSPNRHPREGGGPVLSLSRAWSACVWISGEPPGWNPLDAGVTRSWKLGARPRHGSIPSHSDWTPALAGVTVGAVAPEEASCDSVALGLDPRLRGAAEG
jgi:hypothetical protein